MIFKATKMDFEKENHNSNEEQIISGCPIDGAISVRVDCGFGSYRWWR